MMIIKLALSITSHVDLEHEKNVLDASLSLHIDEASMGGGSCGCQVILT